MAHIPEEDRKRIYELAEEYGVHPSIVRSLYDTMPNELYDGIVTMLEDIVADSKWPIYTDLESDFDVISADLSSNLDAD